MSVLKFTAACIVAAVFLSVIVIAFVAACVVAAYGVGLMVVGTSIESNKR